MTRHVTAMLIAFACVGAPLRAQEPTPAPVVLPPPATRGPINTTPPQPEPPVKVEVPAPAATPEPSATTDPASGGAEQGRGGGRHRGGQGSASGSRGRPPGGPSYRSGGPHGWWGPAWGPPPYFARPYYWDPFWASGAFAWSPLFYAPWPLMWGTVGYWPYGPPTTFMTGGVRLKVKPREAQVIVDGSYAGIVDDFDGVFQTLRLAPGGHKIEIRMDGFETITLQVHVQPDRTLTLTQNMQTTP